MNKTVKTIVILFNIIVLIVAIYWFFNPNSNLEPIIIIVSQFISLITILYSEHKNKVKIKKNAQSKVTLNIPKEDNGQYNIEKNKGSKIKIKKS